MTYPSARSALHERRDRGLELKRAYDYLATYGLLVILALVILAWTIPAAILLPLLPGRRRRTLARYTMMQAFRLFSWVLTATGAYQLDLDAIATLRGGPPMILAPNHPTSADAILFLARHPNLTCILKPELLGNFLLGPGARLAGFIRSDPPRRMIREAVAELSRGGMVLLFPEGTRTIRAPLNRLTGSAAVIARHAQVPIQVVIIETDSPYLGKSWPIFRVRDCRSVIGYAWGGGSSRPTMPRRASWPWSGATRELASAPQNGWLGKADVAGRSSQCQTL